MAKADWISTFRSIRDEQKLAAYVELAGPAMRAAPLWRQGVSSATASAAGMIPSIRCRVSPA